MLNNKLKHHNKPNKDFIKKSKVPYTLLSSLNASKEAGVLTHLLTLPEELQQYGASINKKAQRSRTCIAQGMSWSGWIYKMNIVARWLDLF